MRKCYRTLFTVMMAMFAFVVVNTLCVMPVEATEDGDNISWSIEGTTLIISGSGPMQDYEYIQGDNGGISTAPWIGESFSEVIVEEGVTSIGDYAFYCCNDMVSIELPEGVTRIGEEAFLECAITSIDLPDSLTIIEAGAFGFTLLETVDIPDGITAIEDYTFSYMYDLKSIHIPSNVKSIGEAVFLYSGLEEVIIDEGLESIGKGAFGSNEKLTYVEIPSTVTYMGRGVFQQCDFKEIPKWATADLWTGSNHMFTENTKMTTAVIPDGVVSIGYYEFGCCWALESVTIPKSVTSIDDGAFTECTALKTVYGVKGSYAETFATENGYTFVELKEEVEDTEYTVEITEEKTAISKEDFSEIIKENAEKDVVIKSNNDVTFTFPKGTMTEVKDMNNYDFGTEIIKDFDDKKEQPHKVHKDNFVTRINFNYSGKLPGMVSIKFFVGTDRIGATLHYSLINDDNSVTYIQSIVVDKDGYITVQQDHCSDYVVTTERIDVSDETETDDKEETTTDNEDTVVPNTGDGSSNVILVLVMCMAVLGVLIVGARGQKNIV